MLDDRSDSVAEPCSSELVTEAVSVLCDCEPVSDSWLAVSVDVFVFVPDDAVAFDSVVFVERPVSDS